MNISQTSGTTNNMMQVFRVDNNVPRGTFSLQRLVSDVVQMQINSLNKATWASANEHARNLANDLHRIRAELDFSQPDIGEAVEEIDEAVETIADLIARGEIDLTDEFTIKYLKSRVNDLLESVEFSLLRDRIRDVSMRLGMGLDRTMDIDEVLTAVATHMVMTGKTAAQVLASIDIAGIDEDVLEELNLLFAQDETAAKERFFGLEAPEHVLEFLKIMRDVAAEMEEGKWVNALLEQIDDIKNRLP